MIRHILRLAAALLAIPLSPALAQEGRAPIAADATRAWTHQPSGVTLPPKLGTYTRSDLSDDAQGEQLDVWATYSDPQRRTVVILYIFHPAMPDPALWFDVASRTLAAGTAFGTLTAHGQAAAVALPGKSAMRALRQSYAATRQIRSTGVAVIGAGEWMIKLSMSSAAMDPAQLDAAMIDALRALAWARPIPAARALTPLSYCPDPLPALPRAKRVKIDMMAIRADALVQKLREPLPRFCGVPGTTSGGYWLYRDMAHADRYFVPLSEAGTMLAVGPSPFPALAGKPAGYGVSLTTLDRMIQFPSYATLPPPDQALEAIDKEKPIAATSAYAGGVGYLEDVMDAMLR